MVAVSFEQVGIDLNDAEKQEVASTVRAADGNLRDIPKEINLKSGRKVAIAPMVTVVVANPLITEKIKELAKLVTGSHANEPDKPVNMSDEDFLKSLGISDSIN